ncbi:MAG: hypothetical protein HND56_09430 [Pseudomonadota bacterium]|nr:hypothetical protein [Pseudomonadota bacterium]QKK05894.1 MAG: hypothetical protein HND56_09430 [Pseudomonadota bacterium]
MKFMSRLLSVFRSASAEEAGQDFDKWPDEVRASAVRRCSHMTFATQDEETAIATAQEYTAQLYRDGVVKTPKLTVLGKEDLTAKYTDHTVLKARHKVESAKGGVLFIKDAYKLAEDQYGRYALNSAVLEILGTVDNDPVIIFSGQESEMKDFYSQYPKLTEYFTPKYIPQQSSRSIIPKHAALS